MKKQLPAPPEFGRCGQVGVTPPGVCCRFHHTAVCGSLVSAGDYSHCVLRKVFELTDQQLLTQGGRYRNQLVILWNEGQEDEKIEVIPLRFEAGQRAYAWTIQGREIEEAPPSADAMRGNQ